MIRRYKLENFQLAPTEADDALVWVIANPTDEEKRQMIQRFDLLNSDLYRRIPRTLFLDKYPWEKTDMVKLLKKEAGK